MLSFFFTSLCFQISAYSFFSKTGMLSVSNSSPSVKFPRLDIFPVFPVFLGGKEKEENLEEKKMFDKNGPKLFVFINSAYCRP